jgi:UDPglucose 6-dehydrogenase
MAETGVKVGYAGMTHLGITSAVAAAERGFSVVGFDSDAALIAELSQGRWPIHEPDLAMLAAKNANRLRFTADPGALGGLDLCYVALDVPTDASGSSDLGPISRLIATVDGALAPACCMVILSQVPPGFTRTLARAASRRFYQVETLIFGQAMERALKPERFILGCSDPASPLPTPYKAFLESFACPVLAMRYESAELAKTAINMFLVSSVSTTNTLAELCERIGADWGEIAPALRLDRRIGAYAYLSPGLGIAGGNLERDLATIVRLGDRHGTDTGVAKAWVANSRYRRDWVHRKLEETVLAANPRPRLAVLGLAYKQDTASTKNSPALALLAQIPLAAICAFDPMVSAQREWHPAITQAASSLDACQGADALVVMTPWPEFARLGGPAIAAALKGRTVIDPYGVLDGPSCAAAGLSYHRLGKGDVA